MPDRPETNQVAIPLTTAERALASLLAQHVETLALRIGERHVGRPASLLAAAQYIAESLGQNGCDVEGHVYNVSGVDVHNIISEQKGGARCHEVVVVGAHYDSVPHSPGANDNASGVAALLEIARACRVHRFDRTLRFVAFVNEESPFFQTETMGSLLYARRCRTQGANIVGMCALETIGCYTEAPESQRYPAAPLTWFYPTSGNFIAFVSNLRSRSWLRQAATAFRASTSFPIATAALPPLVPGVSSSDHWSFWRTGYSALMVTDTAPFRYAHYHKPSDVPDNLNYESMARVVTGLVGMVQRLAGRAALVENGGEESCTKFQSLIDAAYPSGLQ
jgi:Zn-dependent M28 family amino/carboxypeptidase